MSKQVTYNDVLSKIIKIWIACYGAITLQVVAGYFMSHILLPYVGFALILGIIWMGNRNLQTSGINCSLMTHYTVYTLAVAGVVMLIANLMNTNFISNRYSEFSHQNYPFHAAFIVYPVATLLFGMALLRRGHTQYCKACRSTSEISAAEGLRRNVLHNEARVQLRMAFGISLTLSLVTYVYYFLIYKSDDSYRKYSPDIFFLYILPAVAFAISVIYVVSRYFTAELAISLRSYSENPPSHSSIRCLVVWHDKLLLKDIVGDGMSSMWDTPADISVNYTENISNWEAEKAFRNLYGSDRFTFKRLFFTSHKMKNCLHCAAFLDDADEEVNNMGGEWFTLRDVDLMLEMGIIMRAMAVELHRVFKITMAWKTYDREGNRLYPIKNYRPTFRLRDFKDWNVDYEDLHWMSVSENNQDKPFFRLRRFWRKYISGIDRRWEKKNS